MIPSLVVVDVSYNLFTDSLNSVKFFWPKLKQLNLAYNYFRGNLNWVKQISTVTNIYLDRNQFSGSATPLLALNSSIIAACGISGNVFQCPVDPAVAKMCPYACCTPLHVSH
jgi:hypothetical protein